MIKRLIVIALLLVVALPAAAQQNDPDGVIAIFPQVGGAGTEVMVIGNGFDPNTEVSVSFGPQNVDVYTRTVTTTAEGALQTTFTIPQVAVNDTWYVMAESVMSFPFNVTTQPAPVPTQEPALFSQTQIFLVDDRGGPVGCGATMVPHTITINPTPAPLTAGLNAMFSGTSRIYPGTDLVNVFYNSTLQVSGISITNRVARIELSGNLLLAGVCENPLVIEQITRTATQFSTIDSVEIFLNGQHIQDVLAGQGQQPPLFSQTQIFLVDDRGGPVGCGATMVPHTIAINPTPAPLTAALNAMFSGTSRIYPGTDLVNVFYNSTLQVSGISITNRVARIELSGNLLLAGVCENPLVIEQITRTATQFNTIDSVEIFLNGQPIQDVLSGA